MPYWFKISGIVMVTAMIFQAAGGQISPGALSKPHEQLEGISNCTKCHIIGNKITGEKCLGCHTEIRDRITAAKGYHSSPEIKDKQCIECHSEHHGKNFQLIRFNTVDFNHDLTGFALSSPHSRVQCIECHNKGNITDPKILSKEYSYLGVRSECLLCHEDYHLGTLPTACLNCHSAETFETAPAFNHANARFKLAGKHKTVDCIKCHKIETVNKVRFQEFKGVPFNTCSDCHKDPHQNRYGQNCRRCHNEESFTIVGGMKDFDHNKTEFPLQDKHQIVDCRACHKSKFTDPLNHDRCTSCHSDYHKGQMSRNGGSPDCSECHSEKGFSSFTYTVEQHNLGRFPLKGAHSAQPCFECHRKQPEWSFKGIGSDCRDCHPDLHKSFIDVKYYPDQKCMVCHNETSWKNISFDHSVTKFPLSGGHKGVLCADCHITRTGNRAMTQKFLGLAVDCSACHKDNHNGQFDSNGKELCTTCHVTDNWEPSGFDHDKTAFPLDGRHAGVPCSSCHKPVGSGSVKYTLYKIKEFRCESCHSF